MSLLGPIGSCPVLRYVTRDRRVLSTAVGLTLLGRIYKRYFEGGIKSEAVIAAFKHARRHLAGRFILVWDGASIQIS